MGSTYKLPDTWHVVWITGASSGIGRELAIRLAASGAIVAASARSADKLAEFAAAHPNIKPYPLDVTDLAATRAVAEAIERDLGAIDVAILNAGVWLPMALTEYDPLRMRQGMEVNYFGVTNALAPLLPAMIKRKAGHIAIVASIAGYRGVSLAATYGPTKAALINLAETLYPDLLNLGVKVTVINPGFVETPMTEPNKFPMPFLISCDEAVDHMIKGLIKGQYEIVFPWRMKMLAKLMRIVPFKLFVAYINSFPDEVEEPKKAK